MKNFFKKLSIVPQGLRYKTMIAFSLMSLIPILIFGWVVITYIFPNLGVVFDLSLSNISIILLISIIISILGLLIIREIVDSVIKIAGDARGIADGEMDKLIEIEHEDEIGDLGKSLNLMTQKIRDNIEELKNYGEKTKLINMEINKKVLALSSLLQIGNFISSAEELKGILKFACDRIAALEEDTRCLILTRSGEENAITLTANSGSEDELLKHMALEAGSDYADVIIVDKTSRSCPEGLKKIMETAAFKNLMSLPITLGRRQLKGLIVIGNDKDEFVFAEDNIELLKVFGKQINIAIENDILMKKAKELEVMDEVTGLYNEGYIHTRLNEEIKRACIYQRPCGYLVINIDNFKGFYDELGEKHSNELLKSVGSLIKKCVSDIDKVGRLKADEFGIVLAEKNKRQSAGVAESIREKIEKGSAKELKASGKMTVSIGVSENPIDGSTADELMEKAGELVKNAKSLGKNRVAV